MVGMTSPSELSPDESLNSGSGGLLMASPGGGVHGYPPPGSGASHHSALSPYHQTNLHHG